uniref:UPF0481 protein At3g47200-like n=1 Tax=Erigeron canadensis TaxID=72917 RepID=UPI001CB948B9|nr:UPF0481 protein At3g47200-like [Erigeron canadensis]
MEMSGNEDYNALVKEWVDCFIGRQVHYKERKRHIGKVPPLLLKGEKGRINREYYEPKVVSLGPYHHNRAELAQAEKYKLTTLDVFRLTRNLSVDSLHNKVSWAAQFARECYIPGSTDDYNDEVFIQMMTLDGCFILFFIECISMERNMLLLNNEFLGALGFANIVRDMFLLENQIPFVILKVLLDFAHPADKGEGILNRFFNYLNCGEVMMRPEEKVLENKQPPLHLLELYRSYFISLSTSTPNNPVSTTNKSYSKWQIWANKMANVHLDDNNNVKRAVKINKIKNYVERNRAFLSVKELKSKGIFLKPSSSNEDIKFHSRGCYGVLKLLRRAVYSSSKVLYMNMIAYEMCPHNPNDFRVSTYIRIMKSLVVHIDDVRELRNNDVLVHSLGGDKQVVKMYADIEAAAVNLYMFNNLRSGIEKHCSNKYKTGWAEVFDVYFSSPWKTIASLAAVSILLITALQTYFTINPLPKPASN